MGLKKRSEAYMKNKLADIEPEDVEIAVNDVFKNVIESVWKRNMDALVRVNFSTRVATSPFEVAKGGDEIVGAA